MAAMSISLFLIVAYVTNGAFSSSLFTPCKKSDITCLETVIKAALPQIASGVPELGIESSDPLFLEAVEANLPTINYKTFNSTVRGLKQCSVSQLKLNADITAARCELNCKEFQINGQYEVKGSLVTLPVEGKGDYSFKSGEYLVNVDTGIERFKGSDGKIHVLLKNFKVEAMPIGVARFDLKNLFDGQEDLTNAVRKFAQEHWREVTELVQGPIWTAIMEKTIGNINKYLENVPVEEIILS